MYIEFFFHWNCKASRFISTCWYIAQELGQLSITNLSARRRRFYVTRTVVHVRTCGGILDGHTCPRYTQYTLTHIFVREHMAFTYGTHTHTRTRDHSGEKSRIEKWFAFVRLSRSEDGKSDDGELKRGGGTERERETRPRRESRRDGVFPRCAWMRKARCESLE